MKKNTFGITLIELIIALVLMSLVILGFSGIELFCRSQLLNSDRRTRILNDVSYVLSHMTKNISRGIGDAGNPAFDIQNGPARIKVRFDANGNGRAEAQPPDNYLAYYYSSGARELLFFSTYPQSGWPNSGGEILSSKVTSIAFSLDAVRNNCIVVDVTGCYDPAQTSSACGTDLNPNITMRTRIKMPAVSTN